MILQCSCQFWVIINSERLFPPVRWFLSATCFRLQKHNFRNTGWLENTRETGWPEGPFVLRNSPHQCCSLFKQNIRPQIMCLASNMPIDVKNMDDCRWWADDQPDLYVTLRFGRNWPLILSAKLQNSFRDCDLSVTHTHTHRHTHTHTHTEHHPNLSSPTQKALRATRLHLIRWCPAGIGIQ